MTDVREVLIDLALGQKGHFSAEDLVRAAEESGIDASRASIYRLVPMLVEAGLIQPAASVPEGKRYEVVWGEDHHDHLICVRCGHVVEFHFEAFEMLQTEVAAKFGFELIAHRHELMGLCTNCRAQPAVERTGRHRGDDVSTSR